MTEADERHLRRAIELAAAARAAGDMPYGSLLAGPAGEVRAEDRNTVVTEQDITAIPSSSSLGGPRGSSTATWRGRPRCTRAANRARCAGARSRALDSGGSCSRSPASSCRSSGPQEASARTRRRSPTRAQRCSPRLACRWTGTTRETHDESPWPVRPGTGPDGVRRWARGPGPRGSDLGLIVVGLAIATGIVGVVVPVLPGALLAWAAIVVWALVVGGATAWAVVGVATLAIGGAQVVKVFVPDGACATRGSPAGPSSPAWCSQ